jgi:hypothetical protein
MTTAVLKISPIPEHITEHDIREKLDKDWIDTIIIDGNSAYIALTDYKHVIAASDKCTRNGDDLTIPDWNAKVQVLGKEFNMHELMSKVQKKIVKEHQDEPSKEQ